LKENRFCDGIGGLGIIFIVETCSAKLGIPLATLEQPFGNSPNNCPS